MRVGPNSCDFTRSELEYLAEERDNISIVCVAIVGQQNNPLYLQSFANGDDALKFHDIVHCSLDVIDAQDSSMIHGSWARLLDGCIRGMRERGADYHVYGRGQSALQTIEVCLGDAAHRFYVDSCLAETPDSDTITLGPYDPLLHFVGPGAGPPSGAQVIPLDSHQYEIILEANSILTAYQHLQDIAFAQGAPFIAVGPPVALPSMGLFFHHYSIAAHAVVQRISTPGPGVCPVINSQPAGTVMGLIHLTYANCVLGINVPRG